MNFLYLSAGLVQATEKTFINTKDEGEWALDHVKQQLMNNQLSHLRVQLLLAKKSVCHPHWQRHRFIPAYNKLYYICDGAGWLQIGTEQIRPKPGQLVFIPGGIEQSYSVTNETPYTKYWCHFRSNIDFERLFRLFGLSKVIEAGHSTELQHLFQELTDNRADTGPAASIKIQSALLSIIAYFIDHATLDSRTDAAAASPPELVDTVHFIDTHLSSELTIDGLSHYAHFHPNYFIRVFKRHLGMTPMRYIHERRLEQAQQLLGSTNLTVSEVAYKSGFKDLSHFSAAFKRNAGVSPSEYRNLFQRSDLMSL